MTTTQVTLNYQGKAAAVHDEETKAENALPQVVQHQFAGYIDGDMYKDFVIVSEVNVDGKTSLDFENAVYISGSSLHKAEIFDRNFLTPLNQSTPLNQLASVYLESEGIKKYYQVEKKEYSSKNVLEGIPESISFYLKIEE